MASSWLLFTERRDILSRSAAERKAPMLWATPEENMKLNGSSFKQTPGQELWLVAQGALKVNHGLEARRRGRGTRLGEQSRRLGFVKAICRTARVHGRENGSSQVDDDAVRVCGKECAAVFVDLFNHLAKYGRRRHDERR